MKFKPHPWHGIDTWADEEMKVLNVYVEITPEDNVKYELDKNTGYLKVDRPQKYSNIVPALYGFIPRTYCAQKVSALSEEASGRRKLVGDGDPLDVCVLSEKRIRNGDILVEAIPIGGFRMIDRGEVDDKIIAVLKDDALFGDLRDVSDCPAGILNRLRHYFLTYKQIPESSQDPVAEIIAVYGAKEALEVVRLSQEDYADNFPEKS